ncbi:unknown [Clostridium sp. CAG:389]|nr:unknown [Clostridium sp. CAG:389]
MEANGKVGTVKMKPFYALKRVCEEYSMDTVIDGGILERFRAISNKAIKDKIQNKQQGKEQNINDNSMFGVEVLQEMGIQREQSGEYVMNDNSKKQETEEMFR